MVIASDKSARMPPRQGFAEIPHTADWSIRAWAEDLPSLFAEAARGMNTLAGMTLAPGPRVARIFECGAEDRETLLVAFLSELLYMQEHDGLGFDIIRVRLQDAGLKAKLDGAPLESLAKSIKAVTFHNLKIIRTPGGYEAEIVFDV